MADLLSKARRSELMAKVRSRGNCTTEVRLAQAFRQAGVSGWRRHRQVRLRAAPKKTTAAPKKSSKRSSGCVCPDFVFTRTKVAVFVDGCFWHACPNHGRLPKSRREFWKKKLAANTARDRYVTQQLRSQGWSVVRLWEHTLRQNLRRCVGRVRESLERNAL